MLGIVVCGPMPNLKVRVPRKGSVIIGLLIAAAVIALNVKFWRFGWELGDDTDSSPGHRLGVLPSLQIRSGFEASIQLDGNTTRIDETTAMEPTDSRPLSELVRGQLGAPR